MNIVPNSKETLVYDAELKAGSEYLYSIFNANQLLLTSDQYQVILI